MLLTKYSKLLNQHLVILALMMLICLACCCEANAQDAVTGAFEGAVVNSQSGLPIANARVEFISTKDETSVVKFTDSQGRFYQGLLRPGIYRLNFSAQNYLSKTIEQRLLATRGNSVVPFPINLDPTNPPTATPPDQFKTGALAVASLPNAIITVESVDGLSFKNVIGPDQLLCVFDNLPLKKYRVTAMLEGYRQAFKELELTSQKVLPITMLLLANETSRRLIEGAGKYYALIIGNNIHRHLTRLKTAEADAKSVAELLRESYGFETKLLLNATREQILVALNEYRRKVSPGDNLLVYYAGHGHFDTDVERAYWLPTDARQEDNANWVSADDISANIKGIPAKHSLIISDSCYSGSISRLLFLKTTVSSGRDRYLQTMLDGKSRTLLASGGNQPVADGGGSGHSVFARALLTGLSQMNQEIFTTRELYDNFIGEAVTSISKQAPEYSFIRSAGHESGDFVFIRRRQ